MASLDNSKRESLDSSTPKDQFRPIWEIIIEIGEQISAEEWEKVPADLSANLDHYLYGAPKEEV